MRAMSARRARGLVAVTFDGSVNRVLPYAITVTGFVGGAAASRAIPAAMSGIKARKVADMARQATPAR